MGKIIRNGIEFSSTVNTANNISYDNSLSGLDATTTQKAIDEVAENLGGLSFGTDGEGNYGYFGADGSLIPFKSNVDFEATIRVTIGTQYRRTETGTIVDDYVTGIKTFNVKYVDSKLTITQIDTSYSEEKIPSTGTWALKVCIRNVVIVNFTILS